MRILALLPLALLPLSDSTSPHENKPQPEDGVVVRVETSSTPLHATEAARRMTAKTEIVIQAIVNTLTGETGFHDTTTGPYRRPAPETASYEIQLFDNKIRMETGGTVMIGVVGEDGQASWKTVDPRTNRVVQTLGVFDRGLDGGFVRDLPFSGFGEPEHITSNVTPTSEYGSHAGHRTRKYEYSQQIGVLLEPMDLYGGSAIANVYLAGEAWIATSGPFISDPRVKGLFDQHSYSMAGKGFVRGTELDTFVDLGPVLAAHDSIQVSVGTASVGGMTTEPVFLAFDSMEVTSIEGADVDPDIFEPLERQPQACDCTCEAFERLQAVADMPHDQQEAQPDAMVLSMCAPRCGMEWMRCAN